MAGMAPKKLSKGELQRANSRLLERNQEYKQRWLSRFGSPSEAPEKGGIFDNNEKNKSSQEDDGN